MADDTSNGHEGDSTGNPHPNSDLLTGRSEVLNKAGALETLGGLLLDELVALTTLLEVVVDGDGALADSVLQTIVDDAEVKNEFGHGVDDENHDTGPEEPVARRGDVARLTNAAHGVEVHP